MSATNVSAYVPKTEQGPAIEIFDLVRRYGRTDAVNGLDLTVARGGCHALFGRNGAGKSTTIKCLLNLLRPTSGRIRVFGMDPAADEVGVKRRVGYMPETVAFYPWMTARQTLDYAASFRSHWNAVLEKDLTARFGLDVNKKVAGFSKGMRSQLGLVTVLAPEPDLLLLDEPTSGLDPIVRRELLEAVIGEYLGGGEERRTVFVSTHLIAEFEGLVDDFTILDAGRALLTSSADDARARMKRVHLTYSHEPPPAPLLLDGLTERSRSGRTVTFLSQDFSEDVLSRARATGAEEVRAEDLSLEEIFIEVCQNARAAASAPAEAV